MYDSVDPNAIPTNAELVAGYVDGHISQWPTQDLARAQVQICTWGPRHLGNCLDIERGDSVPSDIPDWVDNALARGVKYPILYCSLSDWPTCRSYAGDRPVQWWIAHYTFVEHIPQGADACQYGWQGGYDLSLCQPWFPK